MGKKNKLYGVDYFNMSPEEQMANAEMFHDVEQGEVSFLDALNYKVPTGPKAQSDYVRQIERACLNSIVKEEDQTYLNEVHAALSHNDTDESDDEYDETDDVVINDSDDDECDECVDDNDESDDEYVEISDISEEVVKRHTCEDSIRPINFYYEPIVGKMIIDDGLVPTAISVCHLSSIELNSKNVPDDSDEIATLISKLFYYIITCKHPAVIMSEDTFEIEFSIFSKINFNRFVFFKNNGLVYAYVIDAGEADKFYSVVDIFNMDDKDALRYSICSAFAANTMHNIFMYNDEDEVDSVMDARHSVKELIDLIEKDPETEYTGHPSFGDVLSRMRVTDLQSFISDTYSILEDLIEQQDDEDDDDDDEYDTNEELEDDDEEDISIDDFPDEDMKTDTDEIDRMMEELESTDQIVRSTESVTITESIDVTETDDGSDMVLPIIHRRT